MAVSSDHGIRRKLYFRMQSMYSLNNLKSLERCVVKVADCSCTFERESLECSIPCLNNKGTGIYYALQCDGTMKTVARYTIPLLLAHRGRIVKPQM